MDREILLQALRNADAAGDTDAAQRIAELISGARRPFPPFGGYEDPNRGMLGQAVDFLSGANRRKDIPQAIMRTTRLPQEKQAQLTALLATTASDERLMEGISKIEPRAQFDKDRFGNLIAVMPVRDADGNLTGERTRFYPNPRGLDMADVLQGAGAVALGGPVAGAVRRLGGKTAGLLGSGLVGGTEAALVEGASSQLSEAPYQISDIPMGVVGGAVAGKAADVLSQFVRQVRGRPVFVDGALTPEAQNALREAGVDPNEVTQEMAAGVMNSVRNAVDPIEAGRVAEATTLPVPVPLTEGAVTGSKGQQLFEDMAGKGAYGPVAESILRGRSAEQSEAIQKNIPALQNAIADRAPLVAQAGEGGAAAQSALKEQRKAAVIEAEGLYNVARAAPSTQVAGTDFVSEGVRSALVNANARTAPNAYAFADDMDDILTSTSDIKDLYAWRSQLTTAAKEPGQDGNAMGKMLRAFDDAMNEAVNRSLLEGDSTAVEKWGKAIRNYKAFSDKWKSQGGILRALTEEGMRDGQIALNVAPEAASNYIFGVSGSKLMSQPAIARDLLTLKKTLPEEQWGMLRQEAFLNLIQRGAGGVVDGERAFSGVKFLKSVDDFNTKNAGAAKVLFTPEERALLKQFARVSARATGGAVNASNSATAAAGMLQKLTALIGGTNPARMAGQLAGLKMLRNMYGAAASMKALSGATTPRRVSGAAAGAGGAVVGGPTVQDPVTQQIERTTGLRFGVQ
jgi:hypothetical protein